MAPLSHHAVPHARPAKAALALPVLLCFSCAPSQGSKVSPLCICALRASPMRVSYPVDRCSIARLMTCLRVLPRILLPSDSRWRSLGRRFEAGWQAVNEGAFF